MVVDLNALQIRTDSREGVPLEDYSARSSDGSVEVYFRDLETRLIRLIREAEVVVGCVAWLTSLPVLDALAGRRSVSIVVQKEDFLRPDVAAESGWMQRLQAAYALLPGTLSRLSGDFEEPTVIGGMSFASDGRIDPVRCVGNRNGGHGTQPRAHHKFAVFCRRAAQVRPDCYVVDNDGHFSPDMWERLIPYAVWTGSFNFTRNATMSFENAVVLHDRRLVRAYFHEYAQILALSEPLDWTWTWVEPEWRIGT